MMALLHNTKIDAAIALFVDAILLLISLSVSPSYYSFYPKNLQWDTFFISSAFNMKSLLRSAVKYSILLKWCLDLFSVCVEEFSHPALTIIFRAITTWSSAKSRLNIHFSFVVFIPISLSKLSATRRYILWCMDCMQQLCYSFLCVLNSLKILDPIFIWQMLDL